MAPRHVALALLVVVIWGVNFIATKWAVADMPPLIVTALRDVGAALSAGYLVEGEAISLAEAIGSLIIMAGLVLTVFGPRLFRSLHQTSRLET